MAKKSRGVDLSGVDLSGVELPGEVPQDAQFIPPLPPGQNVPPPQPAPALPGGVTLPPQQLVPVPGGVQLPDGTEVPLPEPVEAQRGAPARGLASDGPDLSGVDLSGVDLSGVQVPAAQGDREPSTPKGFWQTLADEYSGDWKNVPGLREKAMAADKVQPGEESTPQERWKAMAAAGAARSKLTSAKGKAVISNALRLMNAPVAAGWLAFDDIADRTSMDGRTLKITPEDYAKAFAGEDNSADRVAAMMPGNENMGRAIGTVRSFIGPGTIATALARSPVAKAIPWLSMVDEALPKLSRGVEKFGEGVYGAGMRSVKTGMAGMRDAENVGAKKYIGKLMDAEVGSGAEDGVQLYNQAEKQRKSLGEKLAELRQNLFGKDTKIDLAPDLDKHLTSIGASRDTIRQRLQSKDPKDVEWALDVLKTAQPKFESIINHVRRNVRGFDADQAMKFAQGLGDNMTRGPMDLETFEDVRKSLQKTMYGNIPMGQNINSTAFRNNPKLIQANKADRSLVDVFDDFIDADHLSRGISPAATKAARDELKQVANEYALYARGNKGLAKDIARTEGKLPFSQGDALALGHAAVTGDPVKLGYFGAKKLTDLMNKPKYGTKAGLMLRNAARSPWLSTMMDGATRDAGLDAIQWLTKPNEE
jgi:hypothetical protein